ncbi:MAG TPA: GAP family protein [Solirubrobacteraceae bacterium]
MPPQALALAFAASIYPPAVVAVIALGRGEQVRSRVLAFVVAAMLITYAVGTILLFLLDDVGVTGSHHLTPSAALDLALGVLLLGLAIRLRRKQLAQQRDRDLGTSAEDTKKGTSKIERYLESRRLAFVLGITLYVLPSPIYIAAVKEISDASLSTSGKLVALFVTVAVMLWLIELPMLALVLFPARASSSLEQINAWFARNGRLLAVIACAGAGAYLSIKGLVNLTG